MKQTYQKAKGKIRGEKNKNPPFLKGHAESLFRQSKLLIMKMRLRIKRNYHVNNKK